MFRLIPLFSLEESLTIKANVRISKRRIEGDSLKDRKDRKQMRQEDQRHYDSLEKSKSEKAMERFKKPAYQVTDVIGYMARKYDVKGEMRIGNK